MVDKSVLIPKADCYKGKEKMHSQHDMLKQDQADSSNMKWLLYIKNRNLQVEGGNLYKGIMDFEPIPLVWNLRRSHHQIEFIPRQVAAIRLSITIPLWLIHHPTTFTFVHHVQPIIEEVNSNDEIPIVVVDMTMEVYNDPPPSLEYDSHLPMMDSRRLTSQAAAAAAATEVQARQPRCAGKRHSHWRVLLDLKALVPLALRASSFFINCVWPESFSLRFRVCRVKKYCVKRVLGSMASSSSCSSSIQTRSGPIDSDVLWMQLKHVSEHVWNGELDRKLHIRRAVPTYQGEEQIPEEIVPLLRQCGFYWIMRMRYLKINAALISAFIERWRPETHMFHLRCGEATITLQDVWLRRGNQHIGNDDLRLFCRKLDLMKRHEFVWESYTTTVMAALPPICVVGSVAWFAVVPLTCFHVVEWHQPDRVLRQFGLQQPIPGCPSQPQNLHGITLKGKQDENWFHLLAPIIGQWNNRAEFRVDVYPRQEGLLGYNSDYMVWYRRKTKMFVDPNNANTAALGEVVETLQYMVSPQGRNTWTVDDLVPYVDKLAIISEEQERITEPVSYGPASEREFPAQEFPILQSSVETRGIGRRREPVEAEEYSQQMMERGHGMYYTPATFSEYPSQMYQYPFAGVDLHQEFSAEAEQAEAGRQRGGRRNPDRQVRRWDRPCGTSSRHHGHHND
ncbi:Serine/threonine-protein phosphatase 7 long form-like [Glycine soja]|uniref:Serine/threonine-protein phosphatase 7 long form-like n=1 Tax=Glycine soja TaxID=3848 RepID=A0A445FDD0_GLYSO|nr:Serine/threonine-protein phosphatase 7 long form-like [Glycine soja]